MHCVTLDVDHWVSVLLADALGVLTAREGARRRRQRIVAQESRKGGRPRTTSAKPRKKKHKVAA